MITTVEAFVLAVMTVIVVAIAMPVVHDDSGSRQRLHGSLAACARQVRRPRRIAPTTARTPGSHPLRWAVSTPTLETSSYRVKSVRDKGYCLETTVRRPHVAFRRAGGRSPPGRLPLREVARPS